MDESGGITPAWRRWHGEGEQIRLGISACLLGQEVRYDGRHKLDPYLCQVLGRYVTWVPVCPEAGFGLGVPRPTIRLEQADPVPRLVMPSTGQDITVAMEAWARDRIADLQQLGLDGFVLKSASPSCGMAQVAVHRADRAPARNGTGVFSRVLAESWPALPRDEETRLAGGVARERFVEHVFCHHRWRTLTRRGLTRQGLVAFHTAHKMLLRAHNEAGYHRLGRIVAGCRDEPFPVSYEAELHRTLQTSATIQRHCNVLYHVLGSLKRVLDRRDKQELVHLIEDYRNQQVPLIVPISLLHHHAARHGIEYLLGQLYLAPHPHELLLRFRA